MADESAVLDYLKAQGLYEHFLSVAKDAAVSDVHVPNAGSQKKTPVADTAKPKDGEADAEGADIAKREAIIAKIDAADAVFSKGQANLYVMRPLTTGSADRLHAWAIEQGVPNVVPPELMHVTQVHSKTEVDGLDPMDTLLDVPAEGRYISPLGDKGALVLRIRSPEMQARFKEAKAAGATWDFPYYQPHVTLSYDAGDSVDWQMMDGPDFPIQLGPEQFQDSNDDWVKDNGLAKVDAGDGFEFQIDVTKIDPEKRQVFGWASISSVNGVEIIDKQGDIIPIEELEKAAYDFVLYSREQGEMHAKRGMGRCIESMVFTPEKAAVGVTAKNENGEALMGWWVGFHVTSEELWAAHKSGDRPEFSIGGRATPVAM